MPALWPCPCSLQHCGAGQVLGFPLLLGALLPGAGQGQELPGTLLNVASPCAACQATGQRTVTATGGNCCGRHPALGSRLCTPSPISLSQPKACVCTWHLGCTDVLGRCTPPGGQPPSQGTVLLRTHPAQPPPSPHTLAHAGAQPGLLYPQTLFMWHIYSKDWNN